MLKTSTVITILIFNCSKSVFYFQFRVITKRIMLIFIVFLVNHLHRKLLLDEKHV